jgi:hypothetical protein
MNKIFILIAVIVVFTACTDKKYSEEVALENITILEDSLKNLQTTSLDLLPNENRIKEKLVDTLLAFNKTFPKDEHVSSNLLKIHMIYSGMGSHRLAAKYGEEIIEKYPKDKNRFILLESIGSAYDFSILPRDTAKVGYYYRLLLKEDKKMDKAKRLGYIDRLKYLNLTLEEYIAMKNKQ